MRTNIPKVKLSGGVAHFAVRVTILLLVAGVVYLWRPLFHGLFYRMMYSPEGAITIGLTLLATVILLLTPRLGNDPVSSATTKLTMLGIVVAVSLVLGLIVGLPAGMFEQRTLADQTMDDAVEIDEFPQVNEQNPRIAPRDVSDVQTRGSVSYRQYRLGSSDIARMDDGRLAWSYAIEPDGFRNKLFENQQGVAMSDMTAMEDRDLQTVDDQEFTIGEGMYLHRGSDWNLKKGDFWSQYNDDAIEFVYDGEAYMYYPKTGHEWHLTPIPHTTKTWDGGALVHSDGTIEHLSPNEAQNHDVLDGQRLYPLDVTEAEMDSLGYRNGIVNQMAVVGSHEGQVAIAGMPSGSGNDQPFVIDLEGQQMSYVTAMEPYGEDSRGLDEVWFADATTGEYQYFGTGSETLLGPERAMGIVRSEDSQTGWGDNFKVIEPVPVTVNDELWWHSKVVPTDNTDITRNVFVNAHSGDAIELHNTESVREFLAGADPEEVEEVETEPVDENDPGEGYYIIIIGEDGSELDRIHVEQGQEVNIVHDEDD